MATMATIAIRGLDLTTSRGVIRVCDGQDTWLCWRAEWDRAVAALEAKDADADADDENGGEAYSTLCHSVRGPVASVNGTSRGNIGGLLEAALAADLIDEDMLSAMVQ